MGAGFRVFHTCYWPPNDAGNIANVPGQTSRNDTNIMPPTRLPQRRRPYDPSPCLHTPPTRCTLGGGGTSNGGANIASTSPSPCLRAPPRAMQQPAARPAVGGRRPVRVGAHDAPRPADAVSPGMGRRGRPAARDSAACGQGNNVGARTGISGGQARSVRSVHGACGVCHECACAPMRGLSDRAQPKHSGDGTGPDVKPRAVRSASRHPPNP